MIKAILRDSWCIIRNSQATHAATFGKVWNPITAYHGVRRCVADLMPGYRYRRQQPRRRSDEQGGMGAQTPVKYLRDALGHFRRVFEITGMAGDFEVVSG